MKLWIRLLIYLLRARWRPKITASSEVSALRFRALPTDLDLSMHVNNGRYLTLMDIGRLDFMVSTGLWRAVVANRWTPIASGVVINFRRELRLFQAFWLETRLLTWSETEVVMQQRFILEGGAKHGQVAATGLFKGGIYDRKARAFVPISRLMAEIGANEEPAPPTPAVAAFLAASDALRGRRG